MSLFPVVPPVTPPVAGLSQMTQLPLFEQSDLSDGEEVGPGVAVPSGVSLFSVLGTI